MCTCVWMCRICVHVYGCIGYVHRMCTCVWMYRICVHVYGCIGYVYMCMDV